MIKTNIKEEVVQGHRFGKKLTNSDYGTVYRPQCGQTQAFWSADKRNGGGAVENRTA